MSRNGVAPESAGENFAVLLQHLTRRAGAEPDHGSRFPSKAAAGENISPVSGANPVASSGSVAGKRTGTRALLAAREAQPGRGAVGGMDGSPLSYEQALRRHARQSPASRNAKPAQPLPSAPNPARSRATTAASAIRPQAGQQTPVKAPVRAAAPQPPPSALLPARAAAASAAAAGPRKSAAGQPEVLRSAKPAAPTAQTAAKPAAGPLPGGSPGKPAAISSNSGASRNRRSFSAETPPPAVPQTAAHGKTRKRGPGARRGSGPVAGKAGRAKAGRSEPAARPAALELLDPMEQINQVDQRRSIVSVRLTEGEFARLRDRAGESGISVSAYMRSCVVDAEQLRAQVKRALEEMRSLNARPEPDRFPALAPSATHGGSWFRLLVRTATVFLSPLFPGRRTASLTRIEPEGRF